jgi:opacity protein-like surface antigen
MLNAVYVLPLHSRIRPFVGIGTGYGWMRAKGAHVTYIGDGHQSNTFRGTDGETINFQVFGGAEFEVNRCTTLHVEYRYIDDWNLHSVGIGFRRFL